MDASYFILALLIFLMYAVISWYSSIEGFEDVRVLNYESWGSDNATFNLYIELKLSWDVKQLYTKKDYTEKINHLFKMTYPNNGSYKFEVKHVIGGENDKHKEFFEFFSL